ncbi:MAG: glycoside hydrolase family 76 protein, partial [Rhodopila sp.]|nr:glycoside hydrolase family 76 protein [Rhodopila sp.]
GGFARYSTDEIWLVPHFEKMLYDNAQLLELLALAHAHRPNALYAQRAAETVGWMIRDMGAQRIDGKAAFAASEDADSEGEEGRFYVWTEAEVDSLLGPGAVAFKRAYDVTPGGNWEGKVILRRVTPPGSPDEEAALSRAREVLFQAREKRVRPGWDDKVLADWNGLAIAALARASVVFGQPAWLERAREAFDFILTQMTASHGGVEHAWRLGRVTASGLIEDQAAMARAALALHEATGEAACLTVAERLVNAAQAAFTDGQGGFYSTAVDASDVPLTRPRTAADNAFPAGNGVMAEVLARLFHLTGDPAWRVRADAVLTAFSGQADQLAGMPTLLAAADLLEEGACVVVVGEAADPDAAALVRAALRAPDPAVVVLRATDTSPLAADHPAYGKTAGPAGAAAYVCRRNVCGLPVMDASALAQAVRGR